MKELEKFPKNAGIYKLVCVNNSKVYIGKSVNLYKRLNKHKNCSISHTGKGFLQNAILKHGWSSFTVEILEVVENFDKSKDNDKLLEREAYYIELFDSTNRDKGYNLCKFSTDGTGIPLTEEHKEKIRQAKLGKLHSEDHVKKLREGKLNNPMSQESREKLRQFNSGKTMSNESKERMRNSKLGRKHSEETKEKIRQSNLKRFNNK